MVSWSCNIKVKNHQINDDQRMSIKISFIYPDYILLKLKSKLKLNFFCKRVCTWSCLILPIFWPRQPHLEPPQSAHTELLSSQQKLHWDRWLRFWVQCKIDLPHCQKLCCNRALHWYPKQIKNSRENKLKREKVNKENGGAKYFVTKYN
jgi:hypothetical protein